MFLSSRSGGEANKLKVEDYKMTPKILIGPSSFGEIDKTPIKLLEDAGFEVVRNPFGRKLTKAETISLLADDIVGIVAGLEQLDESVFEKSRLKVISRCGSGMSNVDLHAAKERGIAVFNTPEGPTLAVAELTIGALLCVLRSVVPMDRSMRQGKWDKRMGRQLRDLVIAIVGYGRIGQEVGRLLQALGAKVIAVDPNAEPKDGVPVMPLNQALGLADVVTLHLSGEAQVLGPTEIALMKTGAYILNAARGGVIDEIALFEALESGRLAGAWIDTFAEEPYRGPLIELDNVLLTPHISSYAKEGRVKMEVDASRHLLMGLGVL